MSKINWKPLLCEHPGQGKEPGCRNQATCLGQYEEPTSENLPMLACNECCGHGCEDGECIDLDELEPLAVNYIQLLVTRLGEARAECERLRAALGEIADKSTGARFCVECGWQDTLDEDGSCPSCGATAYGSAVSHLHAVLCAALAHGAPAVQAPAEVEAAAGACTDLAAIIRAQGTPSPASEEKP